MNTATTEPPLTSDLRPVSDKQRMPVMDLLRGFALIGILFMNIEWFNRPISELGFFDMSQTGGDWTASWMIKVFIEGKFYKLFSILFGMGFAVMLMNAQQANRPFTAWFSRRMLVLFLFGVAHMIFFWGGDILHDYALAGMLLLGVVLMLQSQRLAKYNQPATFLKIGLGLTLLPLLVTLIAGLYFGSVRDYQVSYDEWQQRQSVIEQADVKLDAFKDSDEFKKLNLAIALAEYNNADAAASPSTVESNDEPVLSDDEKLAQRIDKRYERQKQALLESEYERLILSSASFWQATDYRIASMFDKIIETPLMALFIGLPLFLIGYWFVAAGVLQRPSEHKLLINLLCYGGLIIGMMINLPMVVLLVNPATNYVKEYQIIANNLFFYGQLILSIGYLALFIKLAQQNWFIRGFGWLSSLGKMALTNYIMHSVILTTIFYGAGFGLMGTISRAEQVLVAIAIVLFQCLFSQLWLRYFQFGPLEWVWRSLTYLQLCPWRKTERIEQLKTASVTQ